MSGLPVYDETGALIAPSVTEAARAIPCSRQAIYACAVVYRDGWRLTRRPAPEAVEFGRGKPGPGRPGIPVRLPDGREFPSIAAAAAALECKPDTLYAHAAPRSGDVMELLTLPRRRPR